MLERLLPFWRGKLFVVLLLILGGVFLLGFTEAVTVAIPLVAVFLGLNAIVIIVGLIDIVTPPLLGSEWVSALTSTGGVGQRSSLFPCSCSGCRVSRRE